MAGSMHADRRPLGATLAPVLLRAVLALTFIWAGLGKVIPRMPVDPAQATILAGMGVEIPSGTSPTAPAGVTPADIAPSEPIPPPDGPSAPPPGGGGTGPGHSPIAPTPAERAVSPDGETVQPATTPLEAAPAPATAAAENLGASAMPEVRVRRMWGIALLLHRASHPGTDEAGKPLMKLWPRVLGEGNWPRYFAIMLVIAELGGGLLVAFGLLTRLGALVLVGTMLGAIWLDQIGPAIQAGQTVLLVLPDHDPWDVAAWRPLLWQVTLLACAGALALLGAGAPSLDRAFGWRRGRGDNDEL